MLVCRRVGLVRFEHFSFDRTGQLYTVQYETGKCTILRVSFAVPQDGTF